MGVVEIKRKNKESLDLNQHRAGLKSKLFMLASGALFIS